MSKAAPEKQSQPEKLPAFRTFDECLAYSQEKNDNFYVTAFMLEAWVGLTIVKAVEQYAEHKSGDRHLQTGVGWQAWQHVFGHTRPEELPHIMTSLGRFANCDSPDGEIANRVLSLAVGEDTHAETVFLQTYLERAEGKHPPKDQCLRLSLFVFERMSQWLEAILHWRVHWMSQRVPISNQRNEELRELVHVGIMQAGYAGLSDHSKEWWRFRHEELAKQFRGNPAWRLVGRAQSFEKWGDLRRPAVDELTIHWWPLLTRYRWTDRDMRGLLRRVVPHPDSYPLREDKEFADYRKKALGLIKGKEDRDKSAVDGNPAGWRAALAMIGRLSE